MIAKLIKFQPLKNGTLSIMLEGKEEDMAKLIPLYKKEIELRIADELREEEGTLHLEQTAEILAEAKKFAELVLKNYSFKEDRAPDEVFVDTHNINDIKESFTGTMTYPPL